MSGNSLSVLPPQQMVVPSYQIQGQTVQPPPQPTVQLNPQSKVQPVLPSSPQQNPGPILQIQPVQYPPQQTTQPSLQI